MAGLSKADYQQKKNNEASKALKALAKGIDSGELDVDFIALRQGLEQGIWNFRCSVKETEKYGKRNQLSEV